jgi:choline dehydrogenase-like flavoprotein
LHFAAPHDVLAGAGAARDRIRVARAPVERLLGRGGRVSGAVAGGETVEADAIVVAGGAIGTPRLLHRSGIRPPALGHYLSYHPLLICQLVLDDSLCAPQGVSDREPRLQIPPSAAAEWYTLILRDVSPFKAEAPDRAVDPNRLVELQLICPVDVAARNAVHFDAESRPTFEVPLSSADEARMAGAAAEADRLAARLGRYRAGCTPLWMPFGFAHMTGTTRMSTADDGTGVADYRGRVWGFDNLALATNGLIPTRMAVNPTLTGVALAVHVADALADG